MPQRWKASFSFRFKPGFSLRQAFSIVNLVILVVGLVFTLVIVGMLTKSRRNEITLRLANEAEIARREVDGIIYEARESVLKLTETFPSLVRLSGNEFEFWFKQQFSSLLAGMPSQYDFYVALSQPYARKLFGKDGYVFIVSKDMSLIDQSVFNEPSTFLAMRDFRSNYLTDLTDDWFHGAKSKQNVHFTEIYYEKTYLKEIMISLTKAARDRETGAFIGIVGADLTSKSISRSLAKLRIGKSGGVLLTHPSGAPVLPFLNRDLAIIGHSYDPSLESPEGISGSDTGIRVPLPAPRQVVEFVGKDGVNYLLQARKLQGRDFYVVAYQPKSEAYASLYWSLGAMLSIAFAFLAISLYFRQILARFVIESIERILKNIDENATRLASPEAGSAASLAPTSGPLEITQISQQLNLLYTRLHDSLNEVRSERDRAELATRTKSRFLSVMSHEIRTPLNSMLGLTDVLLLSPLNSEQIRQLRVLQRSGKSLLRILNDILDFSRLEAGKLSIENVEFGLFELLSDVESLMRFDAESKGIQFKVHAPSYDFKLMGDPVRIRQVLLNLVGNSIKFTSEGSIEIRVTPLQPSSEDPPGIGRFQFSVTDTGIGISGEQQSQIFSEFSQADASITRKYGGTGLGLAITKQIVELMGGNLFIHSEEGTGTVLLFTLSFPVLNVSKRDYSHESRNEALEPPSSTENEPTPNESSNTAPRALLLVDDDPDNHRLIDAYLRFTPSFQAEHAYQAEEAISRLEDGERFDLILMDMQMPEMDGLEATRRIREIQALHPNLICPVIILSANTFAEDQEKSLAAGADAHVAKPITLDTFKTLLKRWSPGA